ncbi:hypothetical protein TSAR_014213 [Trichomalopsis sarcophagae]|uniref:Ig-like domain-containing protein n=1 Tax=Trichomalopsis sarcophagae TaxID=543379 RepID=A0A232FLX2_9HYME|nr:hypothetical protein TSAR_014213 [Trichomalopsis sarcophagae]
MDTKKLYLKVAAFSNDLGSVFLLLLQITIIIKINSVRAISDEVFLTDALGPEFLLPVQNQTAAIGREATFTCSVSNIGKYKVGWLRASDKMIISVHTRTVIQNERFSVKYEPVNSTKTSKAKQVNAINPGINDNSNGTWRLMIRQLKESDRGCYMCQINTSPMISQLGCLDILVSPDILNNETSADMSVVEGEDTMLLCRATGRPTPRISWKREDGHPIILKSLLQNGLSFTRVATYNGSKLNLYRIDRKQMGTYLCIASNDVHPAVSKRVTLSVNCKFIIN